MPKCSLAVAVALVVSGCGGRSPFAPGGGGTGSSGTLPPGSTLPSDAECAAQVVRSAWEPRPDNATANATEASPAELQTFKSDSWGGVDARANTVLRQRVSGAFTGTTDEIIQWAACKWGLDVNVVRAQAATESWWHQSAAGDLTTDSTLWPPGATCQDAAHCYQSYGLLQIKWTYWQSAWPIARDSTAFNVDAALSWRRVCFEGYIEWLTAPGSTGYPNYGPGDLWGCVGQWYSGGWYDSGATGYIATVQENLSNQVWLGKYF